MPGLKISSKIGRISRDLWYQGSSIEQQAKICDSKQGNEEEMKKQTSLDVRMIGFRLFLKRT